MLLTVDLARLEVGKGDLVLDAGCGEGRHCFGCLERGARVVGLDLDRSALRGAVRPLESRGRETRRSKECRSTRQRLRTMLIMASPSWRA